MRVSDQRIYQKDLPERLLESTQQLQRWYATTKETIKYMKEDAQRRERSTMRDIRTYFAPQPDTTLENDTDNSQRTQNTSHREQTHNGKFWFNK
jgi:hypothetical protein